MTRTLGFLRQHVIAVLALALVVGGGAAFAAGTKLPKNSVGSKQVKNNALKGKDLKDRSVTGKDLRDGSVQKVDLGAGAVDEVRVVYYSGGGTRTLWEEKGVGEATLGLSCSPDFAINAYAAGALSPTRAGIYGIETLNQASEAAGTPLLVGAAAVTRLGDVGQPSGGAAFSSSKFGYGQVVYHFQTPTKDVFVDMHISHCSASGTVTIDHKPEGSVVTKPSGAQGSPTCEESGAAHCTEPTG